MAAENIGCTLAEAAEAQGYTQYLGDAAAEDAPGVHVVYINTSLRTKALAHAAVPTITCTSSNVVQTVLQARPSALVKGVCLIRWDAMQVFAAQAKADKMEAP